MRAPLDRLPPHMLPIVSGISCMIQSGLPNPPSQQYLTDFQRSTGSKLWSPSSSLVLKSIFLRRCIWWKRSLAHRKLHHADPSLTNILIDPTGNLTGIIDWEDTTAAPALLSAAYPEWFRYDGEFTALSDWSCRMVKFEPVTYEYGIYRALYEQAVEEVSPEYLKAMRSGRKLRELLDWAEKTMAGRPFDERLAVVNKWASERAIEFGVTLPTVFLTKKDWISVFVMIEIVEHE
ncbi:hypothetical protein BT96DRAFT_346568 [Gymnopus androsaceus JB14]|uniref:Aminoglycoside phosphotransferase domain-containing protein n=1 Tax=Gymnopus androsaceus JB14 TaxID=1447944 RepID=A0A6A4I5Q9_9AGAR|nr:hypothetical protein BT96DRAFT_346568 [Gymnopus androsaceus JB14]